MNAATVGAILYFNIGNLKEMKSSDGMSINELRSLRTLTPILLSSRTL